MSKIASLAPAAYAVHKNLCAIANAAKVETHTTYAEMRGDKTAPNINGKLYRSVFDMKAIAGLVDKGVYIAHLNIDTDTGNCRGDFIWNIANNGDMSTAPGKKGHVELTSGVYGLLMKLDKARTMLPDYSVIVVDGNKKGGIIYAPVRKWATTDAQSIELEDKFKEVAAELGMVHEMYPNPNYSAI